MTDNLDRPVEVGAVEDVPLGNEPTTVEVPLDDYLDSCCDVCGSSEHSTEDHSDAVPD